jgi:hypothetical protein
MSARLNSRHAIAGAFIGLLLTFQNCSQPVDQNALNSESSFEDSLPLAYEAKLDTLAYMSCSQINNSLEPRAYFTFRAGAYSRLSGGLNLSTEFLEKTKFYNTTRRADLLETSAMNSDTRLTLSIRLASNFQSLWASDNGVQVGEEIESFLPPLDSDGIAGQLAGAASGVKLNYFPGTENKRLMEASLRYFKYDDIAARTRDKLDARESLLAMGFSNSSDEMDTDLRGPNMTVTPSSAHGTGFYLKFSVPARFTGGERRVLSSTTGGVEEVDLVEKKMKSSAWSCPTDYQFMIVRPGDRLLPGQTQAVGKTVCNTIADRYDPNSPSQKKALEAIRRVLRVEDWYVDVANHCVVPRENVDRCYGDIGTRLVQYTTASCANTNGVGATYCPNFVSVCLQP